MFKKSKLYKAIVNDDVDAARALLQKKPALVGCRFGDFGPRPLSLAIARNNSAMIYMLIEQGADVDASGYNTWSITGEIVYHGHLDLLREWAEKYYTLVYKENSYGETLLHVAAKQGHTDIVLFLLEKGLNPNAKDYHGRTPLHMAEKNNHPEIAALLRPLHEKEMQQYKDAGARLAPVDTGWRKLDDTRIARLREDHAIGYRVTEIFNFSAYERTRIYRNMETNVESVETRGFAGNDADVAAAHAALVAAGGAPQALPGKTLSLTGPEKRG